MAERFDYGLNASATIFDGFHKYIRITDIDEDLRHFDESNLTSPNIDYTNADDYLLKQGDILFARTGASVGKSYIHRNNDDLVYFAGFLIRARFSDKYSSDFIFQNTLSDKYNTFIKIMSQRSGQPGVNAQEYASYSLSVPSFEEQTRIGTFFHTLDTAIALHQRKLDGLRRLKKAYLQQMFPQDSERVPRVRFDGFEGEWVKRKLGEVFVQTVEFINPKESNIELWSLTIEKGLTPKTERYNREFLVKKEDAFKVVMPNEFIYNPMNMTFGAVDLNNTGKKVAVSGYYITMKTRKHHCNQYFSMWLKSPNAISLYKIYATGGLREKQRVQFPTLSDIETIMPYFEEQQAIGNFFRNLDKQITIQQIKIDSLKQLKTAYLQKMFV